MKIWKEQLYPENEKVYYTVYLQDNSPEIDENRIRPLMIVCPGGGYMTTSDCETEPVALGYLYRDYHVIVLRYTTSDRGSAIYPQSLCDLAKLMGIVHEHAAEWKIDINNLFLTGFSAGAHLALSMAVHWKDTWLAEKSNIDSAQLKPTAAVLGYPLADFIFQNERGKNLPAYQEVDPVYQISHYQFLMMINHALLGENPTEEDYKKASPVNYVTENTPPIFIWATAADDLVFAGNSLKLALALEDKGVPYELHIFQNGPHGMSMATEASGSKESDHVDEEVAHWFELAVKFLKRNSKRPICD